MECNSISGEPCSVFAIADVSDGTSQHQPSEPLSFIKLARLVVHVCCRCNQEPFLHRLSMCLFYIHTVSFTPSFSTLPSMNMHGGRRSGTRQRDINGRVHFRAAWELHKSSSLATTTLTLSSPTRMTAQWLQECRWCRNRAWSRRMHAAS